MHGSLNVKFFMVVYYVPSWPSFSFA